MRRVLVLLVVPVVLLLAPAGATAATPGQFGLMVLPPASSIPQREVVRDLNLARSLGLRQVRIEAIWGALEPSRGRFDQTALRRLDATIAAARARRLKVLLLFNGSPCWASSAPVGEDCARYGPRDPAAAVGAATMLASRYRTALSGFEVWNEPDHRNELYWRGPDKIARYVALTRALYRPLKRAAPRVPVLGGAFVGVDGRWLEALYRAGFKGTYDRLSVHFYDLTLNALRQTRAVQRRWRDRKDVVLGETGWSSCRSRGVSQLGHQCVTRAAQASSTRDLVRALRRTRWVKGVVFFGSRDSAEFDFGMLDRRGRRKPVARALRAEVRARRARAARRVRLRLRASRGQVLVTGTAPAGDVLRLTATAPGLRYRGFARLDARARLVVRLPAQVGTRRVRVTVRHPWTGRSASRRLR